MEMKVYSIEFYFPYIFTPWSLSHHIEMNVEEMTNVHVRFKMKKNVFITGLTHNVTFNPNWIKYKSHLGSEMLISNRFLIEYLYHLMEKVGFTWMKFVLKTVKGPFSLENLCMWKVPLCEKGGSLLRRQLSMLPHVLCRVLANASQNNNVKSDYLNSIGDCNCSKPITFCDHHSTDIYSIKYNFDPCGVIGNYYDIGNLLLLESLLCQDIHKWKEILMGIYFCQLECFYMAYVSFGHFFLKGIYIMVPTNIVCNSFETIQCSTCSHQFSVTHDATEVFVDYIDHYISKQQIFKKDSFPKLSDLVSDVLVYNIMSIRMITLANSQQKKDYARNEIERNNLCSVYSNRMNAVKKYLFSARIPMYHNIIIKNIVYTRCSEGFDEQLLAVFEKAMILPVGILEKIFIRHPLFSVMLSRESMNKIEEVCW